MNIAPGVFFFSIMSFDIFSFLHEQMKIYMYVVGTHLKCLSGICFHGEKKRENIYLDIPLIWSYAECIICMQI